MMDKVSPKHSKEGVNVWVPGLPGCCSQGVDEQKALVNIQDAIGGMVLRVPAMAN